MFIIRIAVIMAALNLLLYVEPLAKETVYLCKRVALEISRDPMVRITIIGSTDAHEDFRWMAVYKSFYSSSKHELERKLLELKISESSDV